RPVEWPADEDSVDSLLGALEWADAKRTLAKVRPEDRARFGLDSTRLRCWITIDQKRMSLSIGSDDPTGKGVYVALQNRALVYVAGKDLFEALDHEADHFRSKDVFDENVRGAKEILLQSDGTS